MGGRHCQEVGAPRSQQVRGEELELSAEGQVGGTETPYCQGQAEQRSVNPRGQAEGRQVDAVGHALMRAEVSWRKQDPAG